MKRSRFKKALLIMLPVSLISLLIIGVSLTFGTEEAGIALGVFEGILVFLIGVYLVFVREVNSFLKVAFTKLKGVKHKKTTPNDQP